MRPRKFFYEKRHYFGNSVLVEWANDRLELQVTSPCIPYLQTADDFTKPTEDVWSRFEAEVQLIDHRNLIGDYSLCDGFEVFCHITFRKRLVKFAALNPSSNEFEK